MKNSKKLLITSLFSVFILAITVISKSIGLDIQSLLKAGTNAEYVIQLNGDNKLTSDEKSNKEFTRTTAFGNDINFKIGNLSSLESTSSSFCMSGSGINGYLANETALTGIYKIEIFGTTGRTCRLDFGEFSPLDNYNNNVETLPTMVSYHTGTLEFPSNGQIIVELPSDQYFQFFRYNHVGSDNSWIKINIYYNCSSLGATKDIALTGWYYADDNNLMERMCGVTSSEDRGNNFTRDSIDGTSFTFATGSGFHNDGGDGNSGCDFAGLYKENGYFYNTTPIDGINNIYVALKNDANQEVYIDFGNHPLTYSVEDIGDADNLPENVECRVSITAINSRVDRQTCLPNLVNYYSYFRIQNAASSSSNEKKTWILLAQIFYSGITNYHEHTLSDLIPAVIPDRDVDGMAAHYQCTTCGQYFDEHGVETTEENLKIQSDWYSIKSNTTVDLRTPLSLDEELIIDFYINNYNPDAKHDDNLVQFQLCDQDTSDYATKIWIENDYNVTTDQNFTLCQLDDGYYRLIIIPRLLVKGGGNGLTTGIYHITFVNGYGKGIMDINPVKKHTITNYLIHQGKVDENDSSVHYGKQYISFDPVYFDDNKIISMYVSNIHDLPGKGDKEIEFYLVRGTMTEEDRSLHFGRWFLESDYTLFNGGHNNELTLTKIDDDTVRIDFDLSELSWSDTGRPEVGDGKPTNYVSAIYINGGLTQVKADVRVEINEVYNIKKTKSVKFNIEKAYVGQDNLVLYFYNFTDIPQSGDKEICFYVLRDSSSETVGFGRHFVEYDCTLYRDKTRMQGIREEVISDDNGNDVLKLTLSLADMTWGNNDRNPSLTLPTDYVSCIWIVGGSTQISAWMKYEIVPNEGKHFITGSRDLDNEKYDKYDQFFEFNSLSVEEGNDLILEFSNLNYVGGNTYIDKEITFYLLQNKNDTSVGFGKFDIEIDYTFYEWGGHPEYTQGTEWEKVGDNMIRVTFHLSDMVEGRNGLTLPTSVSCVYIEGKFTGDDADLKIITSPKTLSTTPTIKDNY